VDKRATDRTTKSLWLCALLTWTVLAQEAAEGLAANDPPTTVYVTDELRLGLYRTEETTGQAMRTLVSGSRLEVEERSLRSIRVRTEDGDQGWVKTAYIVDSVPARRQLAALEKLNAEQTSKLEKKDQELTTLNEQILALEQSLADAERGIRELPALKDSNEALRARLEAGRAAVAPVWLLLATATALLIGILLGYWWLDRKVRRQFGGVRVY